MEYYEAVKDNRQCMFFSKIVVSYKNMLDDKQWTLYGVFCYEIEKQKKLSYGDTNSLFTMHQMIL